jgi:hypothetical protein
MPEFFETRMGHHFFDGTMPRIAKALERIADAGADRALLADVLRAFEGEEDSVRAEHAELITRVRAAVRRQEER